MKNDGDEGKGCVLFGVKSGVPVIGLGLLLILFGFIPLIIGLESGLISVLFTGFGLFLIGVGISK